VEVRVTDVRDLAAIQLYIKWDSTVLRFLTIESGDFLEARGYTSIWVKSERQTDLGYVYGGHCLLPIVSGVDITAPDNGLVATLTFQVINFTGGTEIQFINEPIYFHNYWIDCYGGLYDFEFMLPAHFSFENSTG